MTADGAATSSHTADMIDALWAFDLDSITDADRERVLCHVLDHVGVTVRGAASATAATVRGVWMNGAVGTSPVVGTTLTTSPSAAALVNGTAAHTIELDDLHNASSTHPGVVVVPAALAACASAGADAATFVRSVVIGYEVTCRVGRAVHPDEHYRRHLHPTATAGAFGAAAAAAVGIGLDRDAAVAALGIVASSAAGSMEFLTDGAWTKRLHAGLAARNGVEAAWLAPTGYPAPLDGLGGNRGFLRAHSAEPDFEMLTAGLGSWPLELCSTSIKVHACCRYNQAAIDAALAIRTANRLDPGDIASIVVGLPSAAVHMVAEPREFKRRPRSVVDAQFSVQYGVGTAFVHGRSGLDQYTDDAIADPAVASMMDRTEVIADAELDRHYPQQWRAWVEVTTADGRTFRADIEEARGDPGNALTASQVASKFADITQPVATSEWAASAVEATMNLGAGDRLSFERFVEVLAGPSSQPHREQPA